MNMFQALTIVRNASLVSAQMRTKQGIEARKVIDRKLQSLARKKAWRDGMGAMPVHMGDPDFAYAIDDPQTAALKAAEGQLQFWLEHAREGDMAECAVQTMDVLTQLRAVMPKPEIATPKPAPMAFGPLG